MSVASPPRSTPIGSLLAEPWAIAPQTLAQLLDHLSRRTDSSLLAAQFGAPAATVAPRRDGTVAVIPVRGIITRRASFLDQLLGGSSVESIQGAFRAAMADQSVRAIVLDVDSPGGEVPGITELATEIRAARGQGKPIIGVANTVAGSAAYWLLAQADEVIASPSALMGSIGVFQVHQEISEHLEREGVRTTIIAAGEGKTAISEFEPLTDEAKAQLQERADAFYATFVDDVAKGRRVPAATIRDEWGAHGYVAKRAVALGMADFVGTYDDAVRRAFRASARSGARAEGDDQPVLAETPEPFTDRLDFLADEALALVEHAEARAALRAREGRPPLSETHLAFARSTRAAMDRLLALADPAPAQPSAVDPPPVAAPPPSPQVAVIPTRSREERDAFWRSL
jgi:signal peptide peptidase SppA